MALEDLLINYMPINFILASITGYLIYTILFSKRRTFPKLRNLGVISNSILIGTSLFGLVYFVYTNYLAPGVFGSCPAQQGGCLFEILGVMQSINLILLSFAMFFFLIFFSVIRGSVKEKLPTQILCFFKDRKITLRSFTYGLPVLAFFIIYVLFFLQFILVNYNGASFHGQQAFVEDTNGGKSLVLYIQNESDYDRLLNSFTLHCDNGLVVFDKEYCKVGLPSILSAKKISSVECSIKDSDLNKFTNCPSVSYVINGYSPDKNIGLANPKLICS